MLRLLAMAPGGSLVHAAILVLLAPLSSARALSAPAFDREAAALFLRATPP